MKINEFINYLKEINVNVTEKELSLLEKYYEYLVEYNSHTNLTSITDKDLVYLKHFYDSISVAQSYDFTKELKVLDIGTGAGFPGVILKIFFPKLELVLLDSNNKKTTFLINLIEKLGLENVTVVNDRAENYIKQNRESFDIVISRAVANTAILLELGIPFLKVGGNLIVMKASSEVTNKELDNSKNTLPILKTKLINKKSFLLPVENSQRTIIIFKKNDVTDSKYPRSYDKILKKPLK
ncbi:MAG: 16S rRNA (guanine(527)-N(7))-methyltransferase RsmG [Bacilli bacterium]|nr:16S rRNA (guanine(527)-N(7))-methyltransferase RsmG [Bacilli bacterium]